MGQLADLSAVVNRLTGGNNGNPQHLWMWVDNRIGAAAASATVAAKITSLWQYNCSLGGAGAIPSTADNPARNAPGAIGQANATGGRELWLLGAEGWASSAGTLITYDRLAHMGGLSGTITTAQTVGISSTRYNTASTAVGVQIAIEIYSIIGTTATTVTASYTNQDGTSGRTTQAIAIGGTGNREGERMLFLPLQSGDTGVLSVQSVTLAGTTGTAGNFGVTLVKNLFAAVSNNTGYGFVRDCIAGLPSAPKIEADACLSSYWMAGGTVAPQIMLGYHFVEA